MIYRAVAKALLDQGFDLTDEAYAQLHAANEKLMQGCEDIISAYELPAHTVGFGVKGCVTWSAGSSRTSLPDASSLLKDHQRVALVVTDGMSVPGRLEGAAVAEEVDHRDVGHALFLLQPVQQVQQRLRAADRECRDQHDTAAAARAPDHFLQLVERIDGLVTSIAIRGFDDQMIRLPHDGWRSGRRWPRASTATRSSRLARTRY